MSQLIIIILLFQTACTSFSRNSLPSCVSASPGEATTQVMQLKILATHMAVFSEEDLSSLTNSFQVFGKTSRRGFWEVLEEMLVKQERTAWNWRWRSEQLYQQFPNTQKNKLGRLLRGSWGDFSWTRKRRLKLKIWAAWPTDSKYLNE